MRSIHPAFCILSPLLAILGTAHPLQAQQSPEVRAENTLFQQYDTVASMRSNLIPDDPKTIPGDDFHNSVRLSALELYLALAKTSPSTLADVERSYPHLLLGAKDSNMFDPSNGDAFGPVLAHEAFIAASESTTQPKLEGDFAAIPSETIDGRKIWALGALDDRHPEWGRFYATQIESRYFVLALGKEDFLKIVRSLTSTTEPTRPATINAWETFHPHEFWLYRTVRGSGDPAHNPMDGTGGLANLAALVFYGNLAEPAGTLRVWSKNQAASTAPKLPTYHTFFDLKPAGKGTWQAEIPFKTDENNRDVFFVLLSMFGFSVVL